MRIARQLSYAGGFHRAAKALERFEAEGPQGPGQPGCVSVPRFADIVAPFGRRAQSLESNKRDG